MHKCPIDKCATNLSDALLMCADHWRCVPRPMQREVYAAYNRGKPPDREQRSRRETDLNTLLPGDHKLWMQLAKGMCLSFRPGRTRRLA